MMRDPIKNPTPLDRASFYLDTMKRQAPALVGDLRAPSDDAMGSAMETLLREAGIGSMTGADLWSAKEFYIANAVCFFGTHPTLTRTLWVDGLMHGIALAGGLTGEPPRRRTGTAAS